MRNRNRAAGRLAAVILSALLACMPLTGCGILHRENEKEEVTCYTREEARRYVRERYGDDVRFLNEEELQNADGSTTAVYQFRTSGDVTFSVLSGVRERYVDGLPTEEKVRWISDNYFDRVIAARREEITELLGSSELDVELVSTGREGRGAGEVYQFNIYLESADSFNDCAMLLSELNTLLDFHAAETSGTIGTAQPGGKAAHIFLEPDNRLPDDDPKYSWKGGPYRVYYEIGTIAFTTNGEELNLGAVREQMQHDYADRARILGRDIYDPGDTLWYRYPAPVVTVTSIGEVDVSDSGVFTFVYDRETDSYWMCCLDPCQDFEEKPYSYNGEGTFARMVEDLGGLYFPGKWKASWSIDGTEWSAELMLQEEAGTTYGYRRMQLQCDNVVQVLSEVPASMVTGGSGGSRFSGSNGTVSGRAYSPEDLEKLLHVKTDIDPKKGTAVIYKPVEAGEQAGEEAEEP